MKEYRKLSRTDHIRVANYYYNHGLTQEQIAVSMDRSRQRINRVLRKCLEDGIVKISIEGVEETNIELENALEKKFNLKAVRISNISSKENIYTAIGKHAAEYLVNIMKNEDIIGFSRGRSISALADNIPETKFHNLTITQLMGGGSSSQSDLDVDDIVHRFAKRTKAKPAILFAPVVVNSPDLKNAIIKEPFFLETYKIIKSCNIAVVGIGDGSYVHESTREGGNLSAGDGSPAAGEICTHYYSESGAPIRTELDERVISVKLDDFLAIPTRIGVAGLKEKIPAIIGAIRGGYINTLITDSGTALELEKL